MTKSQRISISAREAVYVTGAALLFGIVFSAPILAHLNGVSNQYDWDFEYLLHWVPYYSIVHFHQFPFWNPYRCGGMESFANPQSRILTPFFPLHLWLGPILALHLEIPLHISIAWSGGYVLARVFGLRPLSSAVCGTIFAGSSWLYLHIAVGHFPILPAVYLPWVIAALEISIEHRTLFPAALGGAIVALMLFEGGAYPVPQAYLLAGLVLGGSALLDRTWYPLASLATLVLFSAGFAAVKLIPAYGVIHLHPRPIESVDANTLPMMMRFLFARAQGLFPEGTWGPEGSWEYGAYVGVLSAALAVAGIANAPRRLIPWLVAATLFFLVAMGHGGLEFPWTVVHRLPLISNERAPSRFLIPVVLSIAFVASNGAEWLCERMGQSGSALVGLILLAMLADFWVVSVPALGHAVDGTIVDLTPSLRFRQSFELLSNNGFGLARANQGSASCFNEFFSAVLGWNIGPYRGEQYLETPGSVANVRWTPNRLTYIVDVPTASEFFINQNYDPGWRVVDGKGSVVRSGLLLAVQVPAGRQQVTLRYRDPYFIPGALISIVTMFAASRLWWFERRRVDHRAGVAS